MRGKRKGMKTRKRVLSVILAVVMFLSIVPIGLFSSNAIDARVEAAINWALAIANDNYHGYSDGSWECGYRSRTGPDYDCSSLVSTAFHVAGFSVPGNLNTRNMVDSFINAGFTYLSASQIGGMSSYNNLRRGDILHRVGHTELYLGGGRQVGAHGDWDGRQGDSGGSEISEQGYFNNNSRLANTL